jgi:hypothetical protein
MGTTAPKARNVPERADTGAVDPTDYTPTDKVAPTPANEAPGAVTADTPVDPALPEISDAQRKPYRRNAPVAETVRAVKGAAETVKKGFETVRNAVNAPGARKLNDKELVAAIAAKDSQRSKAVKRYRSETKSLVNPLIRAAFIQEGINGASQASVDAVWGALQGIKTPVGYRVTKRGEIKVKSLPITEVFSYTFGSTALDVETWGARQWLNHPTVFDVLVVAGAAVNTYQSLAQQDSPFMVAIRNAVKEHAAVTDEPIKAEARISDAPLKVEE